MNFSDIAILNIKGSDYRCIIILISKNEAINLMLNADLTEKSRGLSNKNLLSRIKMHEGILRLGDIKIEFFSFFFFEGGGGRDVDIEKVLISNKISFGEKNYKYFIGSLYNDNKVKTLNNILPKTSAYVKRYDGQTKWMYFLNEDDGLLEK